MRWIKAFPALFLLFVSGAGNAGEVDVMKAEAKKTGENTFQFHVTVKHHDAFWEPERSTTHMLTNSHSHGACPE
jgi:hypothetical protein